MMDPFQNGPNLEKWRPQNSGTTIVKDGDHSKKWIQQVDWKTPRVYWIHGQAIPNWVWRANTTNKWLDWPNFKKKTGFFRNYIVIVG